MTEQIHITSDTIKSIRDLVIAASSHQEIDGTNHLIIPGEFKHIDISKIIENAQPAPNRKTGTVVVNDLDSLLQYAADQNATSTGYIYANKETRTITAVFNDDKMEFTPGWRDHRASYTAELSREFSKWYSNNKKMMEQEDFAIFLEDNNADIQSPSGEILLSVALTLQAKTEVNFSSSKRLDNGQVQLTYSENIDARAGIGALEIPREFTLGMRIFKNGEGYALKARLKYRLHSGKVKFWYELDREENVIEDAFSGYIDRLADCGYTVLLGRP